MVITNKYTFNIATEATYNYFKVGQWYKSKRQGIIAKFSGDPYGNEGWWGDTYCKNFFIMVTPEEWEECEPPKVEL
jgi:hypothetical protein